MTNLLDLVPSFSRQLGQSVGSDATESMYAAYLADAVQALMFRWDRDYLVNFTMPQTYTINPDIPQKDFRPIILMGSIIYKTANSPIAEIHDGDFSFNPLKGAVNPVELDRTELLLYLGNSVRLAKAVSAPLIGYAYAFNKENYNYLSFLSGGWVTDRFI